HTRFPMMVFGHLRILPFVDTNRRDPHVYIDAHGNPTSRALEYVHRFRSLSGRTNQTDPVGEYEELAIAFVNYHATPPSLHPHFPDAGDLRIETFFDRLLVKLIQRNPFLAEGLP